MTAESVLTSVWPCSTLSFHCPGTTQGHLSSLQRSENPPCQILTLRLAEEAMQPHTCKCGRKCQPNELPGFESITPGVHKACHFVPVHLEDFLVGSNGILCKGESRGYWGKCKWKQAGHQKANCWLKKCFPVCRQTFLNSYDLLGKRLFLFTSTQKSQIKIYTLRDFKYWERSTKSRWAMWGPRFHPCPREAIFFSPRNSQVVSKGTTKTGLWSTSGWNFKEDRSTQQVLNLKI